MFIIKFIFLSLFFCLAINQDCPPTDTLSININQNNWDMQNLNSWNEIEIMTWNIENFPKASSTFDDVYEIITDLKPDIINFQEFAWDNNSYIIGDLIDILPAYDFIYLDDNYFYGLVIAFRKDSVELIEYNTLFQEYSYEFAWRYPLSAKFRWSCGNAFFNFELINVHFKCCDGESNYERRLFSSQVLAEYITQQTNEGENIIVAGDFNDSLTDAPSNNSLLPLINNDDMIFSDFDIAEQSSYFWSYPSWPSHIDHILVNSNIYNNYNSYLTSTIRIDDYVGYNYFQNNISDHRPLIFQMYIPPLFESTPTLVINEIMNNPLAVNDSYGEWFEIVNIGDNIVDLYNFIIKDGDSDEHLINQHLEIQPGNYIVLGVSDVYEVNGNIIVDYMYENFYLNNFLDEIILLDPGGNIVDEIEYDYNITFENTEGKSMMLNDIELDNSLGQNWSLSNSLMFNGDFGTPGYNNNYQECVNNGDINNDLEINIIDVVLLINFILYNDISFSNIDCIADIDENNLINVLDVVLLIDSILGIN